jgi:hypothetical protein
MSKATKEAKHERRVAPRRRHPRSRIKGRAPNPGYGGGSIKGRTPNPGYGGGSIKGRTPNPGFGGILGGDALLDTALDMMLMQALRVTGIRGAVKQALVGGGSIEVTTGGGSDEFDGAEGAD